GEAGPPGPSSGGGPPFIWVCTPAQYPNSGPGHPANLYVFNGSGSSAAVAVNILDKDGNNLTGVAIPGAGGLTYPGNAGASTSPLAGGATRTEAWQSPGTASPTYDGVTNTSFSVRITSDQPIGVGSNFNYFGNHALPCVQVK
ncbi:MAG: hypothetical protein ACXW3F_06115, partial [Pyrinomonadaceae bacterium]